MSLSRVQDIARTPEAVEIQVDKWAEMNMAR